ncbi:hypothetical protein COLO4_15095 [Corchorus olitorius]|uniref:SHSP domain-containing protein n=1 Tax=Corchorus olitorius TaxID=93759 RepID=A0A1R3JPK3_9ROSI|nr:hypothetical protein COLO4_15095 [Corchorus olitorius]
MTDSKVRLFPRTDWKEIPTAWVAKADVAGFKKKEITVEIEGGKHGKVLHVRGQKNNSGWEPDTLNHRERTLTTNFSRKYYLTKPVDVSGVTAKMEDGILTITLPYQVANGDIWRIPISD